MKKQYGFAVLILILVLGVVVYLCPTNHPETSNTTRGYYVAMGDSVAAGVGLPTYSDASACDRTNESYPSIVAKKLNFSLKSIACSGATTSAGLIGMQDVNNLQLPPQLSALEAAEKPSLITMTIGANDAAWTTYIQKCYTTSCGSTEDTDSVNTAIADMSQNLNTALTQVEQTYPTQTPSVFLTGYYKLFANNPGVNCTELSGISAAEQQWIAELQNQVNSALQATVAKYEFAKYVQLNFRGHELCSPDSWIQGLSAKAPFHPTEAGQVAIAKAVMTSYTAERVKK